MSSITKGVSEIHEFVSNLALNSPLADAHNNKSFASAYRYVHALLTWNEVLSSTKAAKPNAEALLQFRELLSDLASAQFLLLAGMYKPARMMLRSSIENILRVAAQEQGFLTSGAKFTHELVSLMKASKLGAIGSPVKNDIDSVISGYAKLCAYTHASSKPFLALRIPLVSVSAFKKDEFDSISVDIKTLTSRYNRIIYALYHRQLKKAHHKHHDFVLDSIPKSLKSHFSSSH